MMNRVEKAAKERKLQSTKEFLGQDVFAQHTQLQELKDEITRLRKENKTLREIVYALVKR